MGRGVISSVGTFRHDYSGFIAWLCRRKGSCRKVWVLEDASKATGHNRRRHDDVPGKDYGITDLYALRLAYITAALT
jgi:hypothetical protein